MAAKKKWVVIDQMIVAVRVPAGLPNREAAKVRRTLDLASVTAAFRHALQSVLREHYRLASVRINISR